MKKPASKIDAGIEFFNDKKTNLCRLAVSSPGPSKKSDDAETEEDESARLGNGGGSGIVDD
jgi:hypothetical protein